MYPLVVIGWRRKIDIILVPKIFADDNCLYVMTAIVDFVQTLGPYRYSPQYFGAILQDLQPRPEDGYVNNAMEKELIEDEEWKRNVVCWLPLTRYVDPAIFHRPPMDMG
ncbi:hypothetical protein EDB81DRAFT_763049 [Dactylonectria macrodidyma]|uniref:Uncharacterized protein n=1 Tax=Dactylonectria macrodidyma TaxID=307937 RepID=A0A9P9E8F4_9HYPO|nr:hypothetical protein EDB81DRAFT_763049 [Dactylonectria macrodidyma]